jgi:chromate reductase, NAD(P)H dehydrogenase (quinone)
MSMLDQSSRFVRLLGLSGSIRSASYSVAILQALQAALGPGIKLEMADVRLPLYNEDEDGENTGAAVQAFRQAIAQVDGLVISTPEYNHGIPGVLKNALDWASRPSGKSVLKDKPVMIITNSPGLTGGVRAQAQMNETLLSVSAIILPGRQIVISNVAGKIKDGKFADEVNIEFAMAALHRLVDLCRLHPAA